LSFLPEGSPQILAPYAVIQRTRGMLVPTPRGIRSALRNYFPDVRIYIFNVTIQSFDSKPHSESAEDAEEKEFVPLRKKLKRKSTGKEDNFMASYYREQRSIADMSESDVSRLRLECGIEVLLHSIKITF
jgi:hypothetical protein